MSKRSKGKRKRVTAEEVRARLGGGGGLNLFNLPKGVTMWRPTKEGKMELNILPWTVGTKTHPDKIDKGRTWFKMPFVVHRGVGPNSQSFVCPASIGKKCPIHEDYEKEYEEVRGQGDWDQKTKDRMRELRGQRFMGFVIQDPKDEEGVCVFAESEGKFWNNRDKAGLKVEIDKGDDDLALFWDVEGGKTITVRWVESTFGEGKRKAKFFEAGRFDFEDRDDMEEDEVLAKTPSLDACLIVPTYEQLNEVYLQSGGEKDEEEPKSKKKSKKDEDEEEEDDDDDVDDDEEEDDDEDEDEEDEDEDEDSDDDDDEDDDEGEEDEDDEDDSSEEEPVVKKKRKKARK